MSPSAATTKAALADLVAGRHGDPHQVLGLHDGVVRAFRPDAVEMEVVLPDGMAVPMTRVHDAGVFEASVPDTPTYRLRATYRDGVVVTFDDAYQFWPTVGEVDLHLFGEGKHHRLHQFMGAHRRLHQGTEGVSFAVWAPNARAVRVVGDFNFWDGRVHQMRTLGSSGVWELFVPDVQAGARYKFELVTAQGDTVLKADPYAFATEVPPETASVVTEPTHAWADAEWMSARDNRDWLHEPMSTYEVHLGSWRQGLSYRELAEQLPAYVEELGFTHVELMPVAEHPFGGSWGYQVTSYYAPTSRFGTPDDFRALVDAFHARGIAVIVDWVPAHFPRDEWALARFDGTALFEHEDPRKGAHPDWGTLVFNFGRNEVRNFLISNALYWMEEFHIDGLRVDAVASMLYLDYSRKAGEWIPNELGGRENLEAVAFLRETNEIVYGEHPGAMMIAEESTAWPAVSRPTYVGGLGFGFKWNMGWMHDTLHYFQRDPVHRRYHHDNLTFGLLYAFTENFVLPLSHDEVVHGKGSLLGKMPGDRWQQLANLRSLLAWMWAHPGKELLFMGIELAQPSEWNHDASLEWHLLDNPDHRGVQELVRCLNRVQRGQPALYERDATADGFEWIDASDVDGNVLSFLRRSAGGDDVMACVANLSPVPRHGYRVGLPSGGTWNEVLNTDADAFGGSGVGNGGSAQATNTAWHGQPFSADLVLPPLGVIWLTPATD